MRSRQADGLLDLASTPVVVPLTAPVSEAARVMQREHVGSVVTVDETGAPVGLATDRDVALAALRRPRDTTPPEVGEVATRPLVTLDAEATLEDATKLMGRHGIRRLGLVDAAGDLVGVVSSDRILLYVANMLGVLTSAIGREFEREAAPASGGSSVFGSE